MAKWNESEHPRDDDGKFTDGTSGGRTQWITSKRDFSNVQADEKDLQYDSENGKIKHNKGFINIQLFAPRLEEQSPQELEKTIKSHEKIMEIHKDKIKNPEKHCSDWESIDQRKKDGRIEYWKKEIKNHTKLIKKAQELIKERKDGKKR